MLNIKLKKTHNIGEDVDELEYLCIVVVNGAAAVENSMMVTQKIKDI